MCVSVINILCKMYNWNHFEQKNLFLHVFIFLSELYDRHYVQDIITFLSMIINFNIFFFKKNTHMLPSAVELHNVTCHNHTQYFSRKKSTFFNVIYEMIFSVIMQDVLVDWQRQMSSFLSPLSWFPSWFFW